MPSLGVHPCDIFRNGSPAATVPSTSAQPPGAAAPAAASTLPVVPRPGAFEVPSSSPIDGIPTARCRGHRGRNWHARVPRYSLGRGAPPSDVVPRSALGPRIHAPRRGHAPSLQTHPRPRCIKGWMGGGQCSSLPPSQHSLCSPSPAALPGAAGDVPRGHGLDQQQAVLAHPRRPHPRPRVWPRPADGTHGPIPPSLGCSVPVLCQPPAPVHPPEDRTFLAPGWGGLGIRPDLAVSTP